MEVTTTKPLDLFRNFRAIHQSHITIDIRKSLHPERDSVIKTFFEIANIENADEVNRVVNIALKASLAFADWRELLSAACGRIEDLRLPAPSGTSTSKPNANVVRALHAAASGGYLGLIQKLYDRGDVSIDVPNESGRTPLLVAASYCQRGAVELLLKCGANVNATGSNGESALMWASSCGYLDVMKTLLDGGANVDMSDNDGFTALTGAAGGNQIEAMVKLVKRGATIDKTNNDGFTALMYASSLGHVESVRFVFPGVTTRTTQTTTTRQVRALLELGADPTACANDGATALIFAAMGGYTDTAEALLDSVRGGVGLSSSPSTKTEKMNEDQLEDYNTYLEATTCGDEPISALSAASYGGHLDTVKMLLQRGASVEYPDDDSKMPLMAAASAGHSEIVRLLLEADPKSIDVTETSGRGGSSALMKAAQSGYSDVLRVLLEAGADPFKRDSHNMSPLLAAIRGKHVECVKLLKAAMKKSQRLDEGIGGQSGEGKEERESVRWAMLGEDEEEDEGLKDLPPAPRLRDREHERNSRRVEEGVSVM